MSSIPSRKMSLTMLFHITKHICGCYQLEEDRTSKTTVPPLSDLHEGTSSTHETRQPVMEPQLNLHSIDLHEGTSSSHEIEHVPIDILDRQQHTIVPIPPQQVSPPASPPRSPPRMLPRLDLLEGSREEYIKVGVPLYEAAMKGDWKAAKPILDKNPHLIRSAITENYDTLLHVAASAESTKTVENFVSKLIDMLTMEDLKLQNKNYKTALALAAAAGNVKTTMIMVKRNPAVTEIPDNRGVMPLFMAASFAKPDMVRYLYSISNKLTGINWTEECKGWFLHACVKAEIFDVALKIVNDHPDLIRKSVNDVLLSLAQKTHAFKGIIPHILFRIIKSVFAVFRVKVMPGERDSEALELLRIIWKDVAKMPKIEIDNILQGPPLMVFVATKTGNTRFIVELIRLYPDIIWKLDDKGRTIFHLAVKHRHVEINNLLHEIGAMRELITPIKDQKGNNLLHMVGKKANTKKNQNLSGAALEMQRELLWYKEVEQMIPPRCRQETNNDGQTPQDLFAKKHDDLLSKGEGWVNNYMLVATLIATIVFAAAFTLPGGYHQNTGIPFFQQDPSLIIFVISDAVSLVFSTTSVLIFLSILTCRYVEHDFLDVLPSRLMFGIAALFLSIVTMMVAFSASFFVLYDEKLKWVPITVTCLAGMPVILFAKLQLKLLVDAFYFAYRSRYLFKSKKRILYL